MEDNYIGKFLDNRYEILEKIGSGGMATVYKARCHRLNRFVAIKILKADLAENEDLRRRFHAESQAVAMLSHPNIVAVYDVNHTDNLDYIVMELIDGITLKQYINRKGILNWKEALHFTTQITKALSHAHSRGIIHRDIKPHNIMILRDGSVKVADFGIARLLSTKNTLTQEALGSVHYISPEQAKGGQVDARSDIYSLGVVMYEMLTSRLPFEGDSPVSVAIQHISSIPLQPKEINPNIPTGLAQITMHAMEPNMDLRYPSADALLADLEEFRKNPSVEFSYSSVPEAEDGIPIPP
ncbi:MAG: serine/threonine protein kinase [Oscillospiraceae bacterium]|nr:serine/threonine protein kinase [Oscillospiraceae bacterium]